MNIEIFGASGNIGQLLVMQAIREGHNVKGYLRNSSKLNIVHQNLELITEELHVRQFLKKLTITARSMFSMDFVIQNIQYL
jgi:putative NADH-flavin reductase